MFHPVLKTLESFSVIDWVYEYDSSSSFVISFGDSFESLLACSIPDLHFDFDAVDIDGFDFEIDTDGGDMSYFILFIGISEKNVSFANSGVSDDDNFDKVVILFLFSSFCHLFLYIFWVLIMILNLKSYVKLVMGI